MKWLEQREQERQGEQAPLDLHMGLEERNRTGQFATPNALALEIVRHAWQFWPNDKLVNFLEPCVGTGSFYSALLQVVPPHRIERAVGYEFDERHVEVARRLWRDSGLKVTRADFTQQKLPRQRFNLLITNPPYARHHHLDQADKRRLKTLIQNRLGLNVSGLIGLYGYFLFLCDAWMDEGGLSVWLIPSEFMDVNYGVAVKRYLTQHVNLLSIHRFCPKDVQFADALVSSAVVVFQKSPPTREPVAFSHGGKLTAPDYTVRVARADLSPDRKWSKLFDSNSSPENEMSTVRFGDLFTIKRGLATGNNDFFILPVEKAKDLGLPSRYLRPILPPPRMLPAAIVPAHPDGTPDIPNAKVLLDCPLKPDEVRRQYPRFWAYLEKGMEDKIHEGYLASHRVPWYSQEDRQPAPFLCTYMGRSKGGRGPFRFIWNRSKATAHNVYLLLYPKGKLRSALAAEPDLTERLFEALRSLDTNGMTSGARVYGGGLHKVEPKELAQLPADHLVAALNGAVQLEKTLFDE